MNPVDYSRTSIPRRSSHLSKHPRSAGTPPSWLNSMKIEPNAIRFTLVNILQIETHASRGAENHLDKTPPILRPSNLFPSLQRMSTRKHRESRTRINLNTLDQPAQSKTPTQRMAEDCPASRSNHGLTSADRDTGNNRSRPRKHPDTVRRKAT